jgi:hypothetical protein
MPPSAEAIIDAAVQHIYRTCIYMLGFYATDMTNSSTEKQQRTSNQAADEHYCHLLKAKTAESTTSKPIAYKPTASKLTTSKNNFRADSLGANRAQARNLRAVMMNPG